MLKELLFQLITVRRVGFAGTGDFLGRFPRLLPLFRRHDVCDSCLEIRYWWLFNSRRIDGFAKRVGVAAVISWAFLDGITRDKSQWLR